MCSALSGSLVGTRHRHAAGRPSSLLAPAANWQIRQGVNIDGACGVVLYDKAIVHVARPREPALRVLGGTTEQQEDDDAHRPHVVSVLLLTTMLPSHTMGFGSAAAPASCTTASLLLEPLAAARPPVFPMTSARYLYTRPDRAA